MILARTGFFKAPLFLSGILFILFAPTGFASEKFLQICQKPTPSQQYTLTLLAHRLNLQYTPESCKPLYQKLTQRNELNLDNSRIQDLTPISPLVHLEKLMLDNNRIRDLKPLASLVHLEKLFLVNNKITDITSLKHLTRLEYLYISDNRIKNLAALKRLKNLKYLYLSYNQISDLTPLQHAYKLNWLIADHNQINDVTPLKRLKYLKRLDLTGNPLEDISELVTFRNFKRFRLPKTASITRTKKKPAPLVKAVVRKAKPAKKIPTKPPASKTGKSRKTTEPKHLPVEPLKKESSKKKVGIGKNEKKPQPSPPIVQTKPPAARLKKSPKETARKAPASPVSKPGENKPQTVTTKVLPPEAVASGKLFDLELAEKKTPALLPKKERPPVKSAPRSANAKSKPTPLHSGESSLYQVEFPFPSPKSKPDKTKTRSKTDIKSLSPPKEVVDENLFDLELAETKTPAPLPKKERPQVKSTPRSTDVKGKPAPLQSAESSLYRVEFPQLNMPEQKLKDSPKAKERKPKFISKNQSDSGEKIVVAKLMEPGEKRKDFVARLSRPREEVETRPTETVIKRPYPLLCKSPTRSQKHTLKVLAKKVGTLYSPESCQNLYTRLNRLIMLILHDQALIDLSPIASLERLSWLFLYNNKIRDIGPLSQLSGLRSLGLDHNQISDISPLRELTGLSTLSLHNNRIQDISALAELSKLTSLSLHNNQIKDIRPLGTLTGLKTLKLNNNDIKDIQTLKSLKVLSELHLKQNRITDISSLAGLLMLKKLDLRQNDIVSLDPLQGLEHYDDFRLPKL